VSVQAAIERRIVEALAPQRLRLTNESHGHNVPPGSESHFSAVIVAGAFEGMPQVARHRAVFQALGKDLQARVHAFTMKTMTPAEWEESGNESDHLVPPCRGASAS
jgi:BolA protein